MRVKIVSSCWILGARAVPGSYMELPDQLAQDLTHMGKVEPAPESEPAPEPGPETAEAPPAAQRIIKKRTTRARNK